jgi:zinc D-Ala-D-Ala dipeptidase
MQTITQKPYPEISLDAGTIQGWKDIPIKDSGASDPLVPLGPLSREASALVTSSIYFGEHSSSPYSDDAHKLEGSLLTLFARRSTARRLLRAEKLLPTGHHLLLFDAYRPYQVQQSLYSFYRRELKAKQPEMEGEALDRETQKYVSLPSKDPMRPSPHSTGGVVDVVIIALNPEYEKRLLGIRSRLANNDLPFEKRVGLELQASAITRQHGKMLDFGTAFDHGGEKAAVVYYESKIAAGEILTDNDMRACNNRRLLTDVMTRAGFQPYAPEWWHFDAPESQWGAASAGHDSATFGAATLDKNNAAHENMRRKIYRETRYLTDESITANTELRSEIDAVIRETGDPTLATWPTEIIAPQ